MQPGVGRYAGHGADAHGAHAPAGRKEGRQLRFKALDADKDGNDLIILQEFYTADFSMKAKGKAAGKKGGGRPKYAEAFRVMRLVRE